MGGSCKLAFTLAEVLIVLGIIGLIADMTIPTLISSVGEKTATSQLKKSYSTFENAFRMVVADHGSPETWDTGAMDDPVGLNKLLDLFTPYLMISQKCGTNVGCFPDVNYKSINGADTGMNLGTSSTMVSKAVLADGSVVGFRIWNPECTSNYGNAPGLKDICGSLWIDINGHKQPNKLGVDLFSFYYGKRGVVPRGIKGDSGGFEQNCDIKNSAAAIGGFYNGSACGAWVLYNGNMDYLHCDDLEWDGKKTCK